MPSPLPPPLIKRASGRTQTGMQVRLMNRSPKLVIVFEPTARGATSPAPPTPAASTPADVRTPAMAQLQDMFPGASASLIAAALAVSGQDVEQAVSALLEADNPSLQQALLARARATPAHPAAAAGTPASPLPPPPRSPGLPFCKLSFRSGGLPVFQQALARAMEERLWEQVREALLDHGHQPLSDTVQCPLRGTWPGRFPTSRSPRPCLWSPAAPAVASVPFPGPASAPAGPS